MEDVECLALKDLTSPRKSFSVEPDGARGQNEHKENLSTDGKRSSPLKSADSTVPVLLPNRKGSGSDPTHITPIKRTVLAEPWTPTANLKVLISAASPDIRDREMKKVLFRPIENDKDKLAASPDTLVEEIEVEDSSQSEVAFEEDDAEKKPSRKQKSLGLLCQKFLALYPDYPPAHSPIWISLDEVSTSLGVERRRIYDIVNVLESLTIVGRIAKNSYIWYGRQRLPATLQELQRRGREQGYHLQMDLNTGARTSGRVREDDGDAGSAGCNRKDKSLRIMSQKFVMLFLVSKTQTVTLDAAANVLIKESQDSSSHSKYKTKVRRLYDIANVLTSLGLIRKEKGRKPAFKWLGPVEFSSSAATPGEPEASLNNQDLKRAKLSRHASFNITPTPVAAQRQVSSAPSSPRCHLSGLQNPSVDDSSRPQSRGVVGRLQCGRSSDNLLNTALITPLSQSSSSLPPSSSYYSSSHPSVLPLQPHPEHLLIPQSHCLAYLPSLSQPSVVMLYRPPGKQEWMSEGQRSAKLQSGEERKRSRGESEEEEEVVQKKKGRSADQDSEKVGANPERKAAEISLVGNAGTSPSLSGQPVASDSSSEPAQPSHYLYVPNNAGLNSLNFLIPAGHPAAGVALPPSSVPSMALPYVLLPSAALSHYPLMTGGMQQLGSDNPTNLGFSLPAVMSPTHFMVGAAPYSVAAVPEIIGSPLSSPVSPEHRPCNASAAGTPHSPSGLRETISVWSEDPLVRPAEQLRADLESDALPSKHIPCSVCLQTPHRPKETTAPCSKAFFQTPGTLGSAVGSARKRGSAQRRLDVSHPAAVERDGNAC
nr:transcription factor E2F7 isoform X2 [Nothobranchius furzeri]